MSRFVIRVFTFLFLGMPSIGLSGSLFVGYELGEMTLNKFRHFAGEIGYRFENERALRFSLFNVALSERHLSSNEASAVEGGNVEGLWRGLDLYYDFPVTDAIFVSPSIGYHDNEYTHRILGTSVSNSTATMGFAFSYLGDDVLGVDQFYWRFSLTFKYSFNAQDKVILGETIVSGSSFDFIPLIFVGYEFE